MKYYTANRPRERFQPHPLQSAALGLHGRDLGGGHFRREQFVNANAKAARNLFQRFQAGVVLNPKFVKLKQLVADTAGFRRRLLSPAMRFTERD